MWLRRLALWLAIAVSAYRLSRRSGVSDEEFKGQMPGDDLIPRVAVEWTRATTIDAPPHQVWPWLVQMGFGRGGWYTSWLFDRLVWRLDNPSSDAIIPEFQHIEVGDLIPDGPDYAAYFRVVDMGSEEFIVYQSIRHPYLGHPIDPDNETQIEELERRLVNDGVYLDFTWAWMLRPQAGDKTRLLVRTRANYSPKWLALTEVPLGLVDLYHVTIMFRGIAKRALAKR